MKKLVKQGMVIFFVSLAITGNSNIVTSPSQVNPTVKVADSNITSPIIKKVNKNVYLYINGADSENVVIEIYYQGYDLAYKEKHSETTSLRRTYDFSTSKKGNYTFYVKIGKEIHKETINIK